ncbi:MAG: DUF1704 domain-containing protein [Verrucomicrobiota bacterium]|nr:DUF1704 domain-containing protein [Verrucomicrobiota bacterium]
MNKITSKNIATICQRLSENKQVRRTLPLQGRLHIDRQLPFICISKFSNKNECSKKVAGLAKTQPSYLIFDKSKSLYSDVVDLTKNVIEILSEKYGVFLIIELSEMTNQRNKDQVSDDGLFKTSFEISSPLSTKEDLKTTVAIMKNELKRLKTHSNHAEVDVTFNTRKTNILSRELSSKYNCYFISIKINPYFYNNDEFLPLEYKKINRRINRVIQQAVFNFTKENAKFKPASYQSFGRRAFVKSVWDIDAKLAEVNNYFDLLLLVSPINTYQAWTKFKKSNYRVKPTFYYNPIPFDPPLLKKKLFDIPVTRVEDPTLLDMFRNKQIELDKQISMVVDRNTKNFMYGSIQVCGKPDNALIDIAYQILSIKNNRKKGRKKILKPREVAILAESECAYYQNIDSGFNAKIEIRDDVAGVMVSSNTLIISSKSKVTEFRLNGLLQHEIGVHLLTYFNGARSPFKLFSCGLEGYEDLQEGLAIFAEFATGTLNLHRLKLLAVRVIAVNNLIQGADFIKTFNTVLAYGFSRELSFNITARVYRSGGYTKDYIYLDGFIKVLDYLRTHSIDNMLYGKYSFKHLPLIKELQQRQILKDPLSKPRFFLNEDIEQLLEKLKNGSNINTIIKQGIKL